MGQVVVINHPLIQHKLTLMRDAETNSKDFRTLLNEISTLMGYEVTKDLPLEDTITQTPVATAHTKVLGVHRISIIPILRAGLGMVDGLLSLMPFARVGHIGLYRDPETKQPVEYYCKLPEDITESTIIVVDPMLATGGSANAALQFLKDRGCKNMRMMNLIAAPEGVEAVRRAHPDVDIYIAAIDECLNENAYIIPGLGDAGDRIFGTK